MEMMPWILWGLENGISPGQPFLIGFLKPIWSGGSYEYDECDADYPWRLIRVLPNNPISAGRSWEQALKEISSIRAKRQRQVEHQKRLSLVLKHRWEIRTQHFGGGAYNCPDRVQLELLCESEEAGNRSLAYGISGGNHYVTGVGYVEKPADKNEAFSRLLDSFVESYPHTDIGPLLDLAGSAGVELTRLDRIIYSLTG